MDFQKKDTTSKENYTLQKKSNAEVIKTPGIWCYMADGTKDTDYSFVDGNEPNYSDGKVTMALATMTKDKTYQLRYQPDFEKGKEYALTFKVKISAEGYILYGKEYKKSIPEVEAETEITYSGTVQDTPFMIQLKPTDYSVPFTIEVYDIVLNAK